MENKTTELIECELCSKEFEEINLTEIDGDFICKECEEENYKTCSDCGSQTNSDDCHEIDNSYYCNDCYDNNYGMCEHCEDSVRVDEMYTVHRWRSGRESELSVCSYCRDANYTECNDCEDYHSTTYSTRNGEVCEHCYENYYTCDGCGDSVHSDDVRGTDDNTYCDDCYESNNRGGILSYSHKPIPIFFKKCDSEKLFYGIELEVENIGENIRNRDMAEQLEDSFMYCKDDGSLDSGFEIVTHPLSFYWIKDNKNKFKDMLKKLSDKGYRSYDTDTCGMHIHISKDTFNTWHLYRFLSFFKENQTFVTSVSQRKRENLDRWASFADDQFCKGEIIQKAKSKTTDTSRYLAVNLNNKKTVEIRIFRGTLNVNSFFKNIEFIHSLVEFTRSSTNTSLSAYKEYINKDASYKNIAEFIQSKKL